MNSGRLFGQAIARNIIARRAYGGGNFRPPTMNDLPKPEGDFFMQYAKTQARHNAMLIGGIVTFATTLWIAVQSDVIHLNYSPPDTYE